MGLRVLVLTIDPARRLATSLGLKNLNEETRIQPEHFHGELYGAMLDMKRIFDQFILSMAKTPEKAEKVLNNSIYKQISTALNGSQEFTALERLLQASTSGKYDLVILDTPPTKHAIDFLTAPSRIYALFQDSTIKWFMMPITTLDKMTLGLMNRGTKMAFRAFEKVVGSEFFSTLTDFFLSIRDWQKVLRDRSAEINRLLTSEATGFVLVTGFNAIRIEEARFFEQNLKKGGYTLSAIIVNRAFPLWGSERGTGTGTGTGLNLKEGTSEIYHKLISYYSALKNFYSKQEEAFRNFALEARNSVIFCRLPDFNQDVHNIEGLERLAERLKGTNFPEVEGQP